MYTIAVLKVRDMHITLVLVCLRVSSMREPTIELAFGRTTLLAIALMNNSTTCDEHMLQYSSFQQQHEHLDSKEEQSYVR